MPSIHNMSYLRTHLDQQLRALIAYRKSRRLVCGLFAPIGWNLDLELGGLLLSIDDRSLREGSLDKEGRA